MWIQSLAQRFAATIALSAAIAMPSAPAPAQARALAPDLADPPRLGELHHWAPERIAALAQRFERARRPHAAFELYCLAAGREDATAAFALGRLYLNGRGVPANRHRAAAWFRRAGSDGHQRSQQALERLGDTAARSDPRCPMTDQHQTTRTLARAWTLALAPHYDLDPRLVEAVVSTESAFNHRARSPKNAHGLMQLLPATAKRFGVTDIDDPIENLRGGMAYLSWLLRRFDGDLKLALAAYNAGEGAVDRHGGIPPYRETRNYVRRILSQYRSARPPVRLPADAPAKLKHRHRRLARMLHQ